MNRAKATILLVLVAIPALFFGLGRRDLWNPVEPRYAGISAEILRDGEWLVPTYNQRLYDQKPALYFWMTASALRGAESREARLFRVRFPSALGGLLLSLATLALGTRLFDRQTGLMAGAMTLTCWLTFWSGRFCHLDTLAAAMLAFSMHGLLARSEGGSKWFMVEAAVAMGMGLLLKGPGILVFSGLALVLAGFSPAWRGLVRRSGFLWVALGGITLAGLWFVPAWRVAGNAWAKSLFVDAGLLHLVDPSNAAKHSPFYYLAVVWGIAAPWSLLIPGAICSRVRARRQGRMTASDRQGLIFLLASVAAILLVLHFGTTYRSRYLLPFIPALMIFLANAIQRDMEGRDGAAALGRTGIAIGLCALLVAGLTLSFSGFLASQIKEGQLAEFLTALAQTAETGAPLGLLTAGAAVFGFYRLTIGRARTAVAALVVAVALGFGSWGLYGAPAMDRIRGDAELIAALQEALPGRKLAAIEAYATRESTEGLFGFELGRPLISVRPDPAVLADLFEGEPMLLMIRRRDLAEMPAHALLRWSRLSEQSLGRHSVWLYANDDRGER